MNKLAFKADVKKKNKKIFNQGNYPNDSLMAVGKKKQQKTKQNKNPET